MFEEGELEVLLVHVKEFEVKFEAYKESLKDEPEELKLWQKKTPCLKDFLKFLDAFAVVVRINNSLKKLEEEQNKPTVGRILMKMLERYEKKHGRIEIRREGEED